MAVGGRALAQGCAARFPWMCTPLERSQPGVPGPLSRARRLAPAPACCPPPPPRVVTESCFATQQCGLYEALSTGKPVISIEYCDAAVVRAAPGLCHGTAVGACLRGGEGCAKGPPWALPWRW